MPFRDHVLAILEYPAVLAQLARRTAFSASKELALALRPSGDLALIRTARARRRC
jgi:dsDNA-specific endonuclease/ATPase MutS2